MCRVWMHIYSFDHGIHTAHFRVKIRAHTRRISEFLEMDKILGAYSIQIYDYLSQIQLDTKAFLLIVRHDTEGLEVTSSNALFLRRIAESSQPSIIL